MNTLPRRLSVSQHVPVNKELTIGITGSSGLLGWHMACYLRSLPNVKLLFADRSSFAQTDTLERFVSVCDVILHFAGMIRGEDQALLRTNLQLTNELIHALEAVRSQSHVIFSNSIHKDRDSAYGQSKRETTRLLNAWSERSNGIFSDVVLPNAFGEFGKPFYNSVVSTFCYQLVNHQPSLIKTDAPLELIHAQTIAREFWKILQSEATGEIRLNGHQITVSNLLKCLQSLDELYQERIFSDVNDAFDRDLFNTFRSYMDLFQPFNVKPVADVRNKFFEMVGTYNPGQSVVTNIQPGETRGHCYHTRKIERFLVVSGEAEIVFRRVLTNQQNSFRVSGHQPALVDIPTLHSYSITNIGFNTLEVLSWTLELLNPDETDTILENV